MSVAGTFMNRPGSGSLREALMNGFFQIGSESGLPVIVAVDDAENENAFRLQSIDNQVIVEELESGGRVHLMALAIGQRKLCNANKSLSEFMCKRVRLR
jgi:hypothetical protein